MSAKKEEQRRVKAEKQAAHARKEKWLGLAGKIAAAVMIPLVVGVLLYGFFTGQAAMPPDAVSSNDQVIGNNDGSVTLTVYADFQCPACAAENQLIIRAWPRIADRVKLVYRHYPLDTHNHSFLAARYSEAAGRQQKFWEFHDVLFANQTLWAGERDAAVLFDGYAKELGLDIDKLHADIELPEIRDKVLADQRGGTRAGVRSTPSLFVNGRLVPSPQTVSDLVALVEKAAAGGE